MEKKDSLVKMDFRMSLKHRELLEKIKKKTGISVSALIRHAVISKYELGKHPNLNLKEENEGNQNVGVIQSSPTNIDSKG